VVKFLKQGKKDGKLITDNDCKSDKSNFIKFIIFLDSPINSKIYTNEIFKPVIIFKMFKTEKKAIELANKINYGLIDKFI